MQIKESQCPRGHYVCPDVDCQYISSREERIPKHVISQHSKQGPFVDKAKEDLQRIKLEKESAQGNKKANIIKLEQEVKEVKIKKEMTDLREALKRVEEIHKNMMKEAEKKNQTKTKG